MRRLAPLLLGLGALLACGSESDQRHPGIEAESFRGPPPDALRACASGPTVSGVDTSMWDGTIDWNKVAASGMSFGITKATEGVTYADPSFTTNWSGMKSAGLVRGAYHFFRPLDSGVQQADWFLSKVGAFAEGDLPPVLDWEVTDPSVSSAKSIQEVQDFVDEVRSRTGLTTIVYSSKRFLSLVGNPTQFAGLPLWDAWWQSGCPDIPDAWQTWTFWQYSSTVWVPGINGGDAGVDVNYFNGSQEDLLALTGAGQPDAGPDAGPAPDAGIADAGIADAGIADAGNSDAGTADAGTADAGDADAGDSDAGADAGDSDGGTSADAGSGNDTPPPSRTDGGDVTLAAAAGCASSGSTPLPMALLLLAMASIPGGRARRG